MANLKTWITYHLPRTRVRIQGTATEKLDLRSGKKVKEVTSAVTLESEADPEAFYRVDLGTSKLSDSSLSLHLSDDGLLLTTEAKSTGKLGKIVRNVFGFVTTIAGAVASLAAVPTAAGFEEPETGSPIDSYGTEHPERANRRRQLAEALDGITTKIIELESSLTAKDSAEERKKIVAHVGDLKKAAECLREEAKLLDVHFEAWKARKEAATTISFEFTFGLDELPTITGVDSWQGEPTPEQLKGFATAYQALDLVVARADVQPLPSGSFPTPATAGKEYMGVYFRQARPIRLALYSKRDGALVKVKETFELAMDGECRTGFVASGETKWSEKSAALTFSQLGGLQKVQNSKASELAAATDALKELPAEMISALEQANKIIDQQQQLSLQGIEQRIAELGKQKSLIEAEIALGDAIDTRAQTEELHRIKAEIDLLKARKDLGDSQRQLQLVQEGSAIQLETEILKLRVGLEQAQIERLKAEAELEKLQAGD